MKLMNTPIPIIPSFKKIKNPIIFARILLYEFFFFSFFLFNRINDNRKIFEIFEAHVSFYC